MIFFLVFKQTNNIFPFWFLVENFNIRFEPSILNTNFTKCHIQFRFLNTDTVYVQRVSSKQTYLNAMPPQKCSRYHIKSHIPEFPLLYVNNSYGKVFLESPRSVSMLRGINALEMVYIL